jgi:hypothetical protein
MALHQERIRHLDEVATISRVLWWTRTIAVAAVAWPTLQGVAWFAGTVVGWLF